MPEPLDFESIARRMTLAGPDELTIIEGLRSVWNARGAADADAVDTRLSTLTGWVTSEPYRVQLRHAIRSLDR